MAIVGIICCAGRIADGTTWSVSGGTALGFAGAGFSLLLWLATGSRHWTQAGILLLSVAPFAVSALNVARLSLHIGVSDFVSGFLPEQLVPLAHMSPNDAIHMSLITSGILLMTAANKWVRGLAELAIVGACLISLMTLLGLIFGMPNLCLFVSCLTISWLSGITFAVLSIALVLANTKDGIFFSVLAAPDAGGVIARRMLPTAAGMPILLGWLREAGQKAGIFDGETGLTVMIVMLVLLTLSIIWGTSWSLSRADLARRQALADLEASEKRTRMIVQQATDAFVAIDSQGLIRDWNVTAEETFGWTRAEALGAELAKTIAPHDENTSQLAQLFAAGETTLATKPLESQAMDKDGRCFPIELSMFPITVDGERMVCAFLRDITERRELQQRLRDFYSTVAHELRAPLTSIRGSLSMAAESTDRSLTSRLYQNMDASVSRLIRLINDLLDVKRIEEGRLELDLEEHDSLDIVMRAVDELSGLAANANVELVPVVDKMARVNADADRIVQVLANLISNAVKFSPAESVVLIKTEAAAAGYIRFAVIDQGAGIPRDQLHKIFTRFGQVQGAAGKKKAGTGLGLVISRAIIEQHGGNIGLESNCDQGCKFWFDLPTAQAPAAASGHPDPAMIPATIPGELSP